MILLIEDNALLAKCLRLLLEPSAVVVVASTMAQALQHIEQTGPKDTVMVDLALPDSAPCVTLCRIAEWKRRADAPRVVIITGIYDRKVVAAAHASPADAVALKHDEVGFFETLKGLGLLRRPKERCADMSIVEEIERHVQSITGSPYAAQTEQRTVRVPIGFGSEPQAALALRG